jgi:hypothetical protein
MALYLHTIKNVKLIAVDFCWFRNALQQLDAVSFESFIRILFTYLYIVKMITLNNLMF